ncbi:hypothetical protein Q0590_08430 [Rhodocytophaga aerolata]|uniref:Uncharacterized protein n=1 Tax=Rhodocytophaga aerolata TaxID=455078 RepID=A0ABT8R6G1_9BACT|nr:hypothetical protein [Rhodocytophaga aerolata]MDO1446275.1 hypothetical protein [Rhodocytophaga aerolata]
MRNPKSNLRSAIKSGNVEKIKQRKKEKDYSFYFGPLPDVPVEERTGFWFLPDGITSF